MANVNVAAFTSSLSVVGSALKWDSQLSLHMVFFFSQPVSRRGATIKDGKGVTNFGHHSILTYLDHSTGVLLTAREWYLVTEIEFFDTAIEIQH